ncbi:Trans-aconitate 2-methyltransferase [Planctomycetes bacterium Poly30]|uniref:Trans-aconitate 2-methyltransferase n=1 Tax=Saltatorellus ferox TaxID=2528018 RepID=A0A518ENT0_9BACT|nr:Trans-aconitate 2-methyltransferase [Planctomycetes bacterium Poly30]
MIHYPFEHDAEEHERLQRQDDLFRPLTRSFLAAVEAEGVKRVLDIGTGTGANHAVLAERFGPGLHITGLDPDRAAMQIASRRLPPGVKFFEPVPESIEEYRPDQAFDLAFMRCVLMYCDDPVATVKKVASFVRPGGYVLIQDADHSSYCRTEPESLEFAALHHEIQGYGVTAGVHENMGLRLVDVFVDSGLTPRMEHRAKRHDGVSDPRIFALLGRTVVGMRRKAAAVGIPHPAEMDANAIASRLEALAAGRRVFSSTLVGVAAQLPLEVS